MTRRLHSLLIEEKKNLFRDVVAAYRDNTDIAEVARRYDVNVTIVSGIANQLRNVGVAVPKKKSQSLVTNKDFIEELKRLL